MSKSFWERGDISRVAREVGISPQNLSDILHRRRAVNVKLAVKLEAATGVSAIQWVASRISKHAAFFGKPARSL